MDQVKIREAIPTDINFIYSCWLRSYRNDSDIGLSVTKTVFFDSYQQIIDGILNRSTTKVFVACKPDEPTTIFGFLVAESSVKILHYCFIKDAFRGFGLANLLFQEAFLDSKKSEVIITHKTYTCKSLCDCFLYNPFNLFSKGE
jgi:hypothetical protein